MSKQDSCRSLTRFDVALGDEQRGQLQPRYRIEVVLNTSWGIQVIPPDQLWTAILGLSRLATSVELHGVFLHRFGAGGRIRIMGSRVQDRSGTGSLGDEPHRR